MRIEVAALSFSMLLLSICDQQLRSTYANLCSHTVKKSAARSNNSTMLQDQILQT